MHAEDPPQAPLLRLGPCREQNRRPRYLHIPLSQEAVPPGHCESRRHCTHRPASPQNGVVPLQSVFAWHCVHVPDCVLQIGVDVPAQSALVPHWLHLDVAVLHFGAVAGHCMLLVHPARHVKSWLSQTGAAAPQSEFARHETHRCSRRRHRGAAAEQSVFARQSTHENVFGSHTPPRPAQSMLVLHWTQAPDVMSQIEAPPIA
jgi:hypothetical protein